MIRINKKCDAEVVAVNGYAADRFYGCSVNISGRNIYLCREFYYDEYLLKIYQDISFTLCRLYAFSFFDARQDGGGITYWESSIFDFWESNRRMLRTDAANRLPWILPLDEWIRLHCNFDWLN